MDLIEINEEQFRELMKKLEEIRCCIIDVETAIEKRLPDPSSLTHKEKEK